MNDFHNITPRPKRGSNGTYFVDPVDEKHGKMRGKSVPADKFTTFVNRFHDYGYNRDRLEQKGRQSYYYHRHEGAWSDVATANRVLISMASSQARAQIHSTTQGPIWKAEFENYCKAKEDQPHYGTLYTYVYAVLFQQIKNQMEADFATHVRTDLINQFEKLFSFKRARELYTMTDVSYSGVQTDAYITHRLV